MYSTFSHPDNVCTSQGQNYVFSSFYFLYDALYSAVYVCVQNMLAELVANLLWNFKPVCKEQIGKINKISAGL